MDDNSRYKPVRLHYDKYVPENCDPDLPPIIFIHGIAATLSTWTTVKLKIARNTKRQVYAYDLRNHGKSEWNDDFSVKSHVADLENFIIQEGLKNPILVGHSLGGKIILTLVLQKPEVVGKVILEEIKLDDVTEEESKKFAGIIKSSKRIRDLPSGLSIEAAKDIAVKMAKSWFPEQNFLNNDVVFEAIQKDRDGKFIFDFNIDAVHKSFENPETYQTNFKECKIFPGPALFLYFEKSAMKVNEDKLIPEFFPNVKFCAFDRGGHAPHIEVREEYVEAVSKFINNI